MRVDLEVPFAEKDAARRLGARWDAARRVWYLTDAENLAPFLRWMPKHLTRPHHGTGSTTTRQEKAEKRLTSEADAEAKRAMPGIVARPNGAAA